MIAEALEPRWCPALDVPALSSLPGADHTIYLDFNGHVTENTNWNSYFNNPSVRSPAYNTDSDPNSYSAAELADVEAAWLRIAEDFLPFEVNVTTVDPGVDALSKLGGGDTQWGVRVVITSDTERTGAGGIAYPDSFNWSSDTPVFVYVTSGKYIAEAASHEVGHSLGLSHDGSGSSAYYYGHGSGATSWAPLMGVGYYSEVTQWDRGEFSGSNNGGSSANYGKGPQDVAVITTYNGFGFRADDHGDDPASATGLVTAGGVLSGAGIISTAQDVDVLAFVTGAGLVTLDVSPANLGANLDVKADLLDANGNLVATANPEGKLDAQLSVVLEAGTYYLHIDGTGIGNPQANPPTGYSDYGSLGQYTISGQVVDAGSTVSFTVNDVSVDESQGQATFVVTVTGTLETAVSVGYQTVADSALADSDYSPVAGRVTFEPDGPVSQLITVPILNDTLSEASERFYLQLKDPSPGSLLTKLQGAAVIADDDISISVTDTSLREGTPKGRKASGPQFSLFTFTVNLSAPAGGEVRVRYETLDGTAKAGSDFSYASGEVVFAPGDVSKSLTVDVLMDSTVEANEQFHIVLSSASGANIIDGLADGIIMDDDAKTGGKPPRGIAVNQANTLQPVRDEFHWFNPLAHDHDHMAGHFEGDTNSPLISPIDFATLLFWTPDPMAVSDDSFESTEDESSEEKSRDFLFAAWSQRIEHLSACQVTGKETFESVLESWDEEESFLATRSSDAWEAPSNLNCNLEWC